MTTVRLASHLHRSGGHEFESPAWIEFGVLTESGKTLGVRSSYNVEEMSKKKEKRKEEHMKREGDEILEERMKGKGKRGAGKRWKIGNNRRGAERKWTEREAEQ